MLDQFAGKCTGCIRVSSNGELSVNPMRSILLASLSLLAFAFPVTGQNPANMSGERLLTAFGEDEEGGVPLRWVTVLDGVMGGRSSGAFEIEDGTLRFSGVLNTNGGGFSSMRAPTSVKLGNYEGIHLRVRGDGRTYSLRLQQSGQDRRRAASYRAEFPTLKGDAWQDVWLPFDQFVPTWRGRQLDLPKIDPNRLRLIGLSMADGIDGPFQIEVDSLHAYGRFDLADYAQKRRPLLLFAPRADDSRLLRLLADVEANRAVCTERAMTLVVVTADGLSRVGGRPLTAAASQALRETYDVAKDEFCLTLVGKDGRIKRSEYVPVKVSELIAQIDRMPKRTNQARRRIREF